jgi:acetyl-CoA decarbonylase/synthase complex subunit gamma
MALAQKKASLDKCPHVSAQAKDALESAAQPPIKLVTVGIGDRKIEIGNETVMYRHEQKFYHPAAIGFVIEDSWSDDEIVKTTASINALTFERVGQKIGVNIICVKNSSKYQNKFVSAVKKVSAKSDLALALCSQDAASMAEALSVVKDSRPLVVCEAGADTGAFAKLAKDNKVPLAVTCANLDDIAAATEKAKAAGVDEIVINVDQKNIAKRVQIYTYIRRMALKKNTRSLGYPIIAFTESADHEAELAEAVTYILKYAGIVIIKNVSADFVFPALVSRQDIYNDPQKPVQVEPKVYEIGKVTKDSPLLVTTNFSITYFTVAGEVESSKVPSYIVCCDSEGMSVLTAWAAEKFTAERIADSLKKFGAESLVSHNNVVIPGYVAVLSSKLEEVTGRNVMVGPREASGLPGYLRGLKRD